jgi:hypothetical protein
MSLNPDTVVHTRQIVAEVESRLEPDRHANAGV